ncbi:MAG: acetylxylan esterase, partial [Balneolales bacterium]
MIRKEPGSGSSSFIQGLFYAAFILMVVPGSLWAQNELNVIQGSSSNNSWHHFDNASNFLYDHLAGQAYDLLDNRMAEISGLRSLSDWQGRQQEVRETLRDIMGPFPEKTPLNARILRTIEKDGYRVEHIVFESQPKFYVTATLFIPDGLRERAPAVLYLSGHTQNGYRSETYQHKMLNLVRKGFIVFAIDPVGQGERMGYIEPETGRSLISSSTREHSYAGVQAFITKSSLARYMTWDGIRAVDYLLSREEVDPDRLGLTGRSGGGTQSSYIAAMDERIYAAAPEAYITTFTRILQSIGPQDLEQNLYHGIARGIDHADLLAVRAPKPALMITTTEDFFSIQGARESARELSALYGAYGQAGQFKMVEDGGSHQSTPQNREAMYAFFQKHLDNPGDPRDEDVELLSEAEIQVTPTGQVATSLGGETVFSLNRREAERRMETLYRLRNDPDGYVPEMLEAA